MPAFDRILQLARMEEMGCEFVEVTAHEGARPTHAVWQGRVYHRGGAVVQDGERYEDFEAATDYGTGPGLCGWNCRHNFYPFYPGISVRNYTDERLAELDARNIPYGGGCTPGTRSPRCSGRWNAGCAKPSAVTWPRPPPGWMPAKAPPSRKPPGSS